MRDSDVTGTGAARPQGGLRALWGEARALGGAVLFVGCAVAGYAIRYAFVEPTEMGAACERAYPWWCPLRTGFIIFTEWNGFGVTAMLFAALALGALLAGRPSAVRRLAVVALVAGGLGSILYNTTYSVPAVIVAGLCLIRVR